MSEALEVEFAALAELALAALVSLLELPLTERPNCASVCSRAFNSALLVGLAELLLTLLVLPVAPLLLACDASSACTLVNALLDVTLLIDMLAPVRPHVRPGAPGSKDEHLSCSRGEAHAHAVSPGGKRCRGN